MESEIVNISKGARRALWIARPAILCSLLGLMLLSAGCVPAADDLHASPSRSLLPDRPTPIPIQQTQWNLPIVIADDGTPMLVDTGSVVMMVSKHFVQVRGLIPRPTNLRW